MQLDLALRTDHFVHCFGSMRCNNILLKRLARSCKIIQRPCYMLIWLKGSVSSFQSVVYNSSPWSAGYASIVPWCRSVLKPLCFCTASAGRAPCSRLPYSCRPILRLACPSRFPSILKARKPDPRSRHIAFHVRAHETFSVCQAKCNAISEDLLVAWSQQFEPSYQSNRFLSRDLWWSKSKQCEHGTKVFFSVCRWPGGGLFHQCCLWMFKTAKHLRK